MKAQTEPSGFLNCLIVLCMHVFVSERLCACRPEHICSSGSGCEKTQVSAEGEEKNALVPSLSDLHTHNHTATYTPLVRTQCEEVIESQLYCEIVGSGATSFLFFCSLCECFVCLRCLPHT